MDICSVHGLKMGRWFQPNRRILSLYWRAGIWLPILPLEMDVPLFSTYMIRTVMVGMAMH